MQIGTTVLCLDDNYLAPFLLKDAPSKGEACTVEAVVDAWDEYGPTKAIKLRTTHRRFSGAYNPKRFRVLLPHELRMKELV